MKIAQLIDLTAPLGERIQGGSDRAAWRPAIARHPQAIGAQGIDGDDQDVAGKGTVPCGCVWRTGSSGLGAGRGRLGVACLAVVVDAVAGNVLGAGHYVGA